MSKQKGKGHEKVEFLSMLSRTPFFACARMLVCNDLATILYKWLNYVLLETFKTYEIISGAGM